MSAFLWPNYDYDKNYDYDYDKNIAKLSLKYHLEWLKRTWVHHEVVVQA